MWVDQQLIPSISAPTPWTSFEFERCLHRRGSDGQRSVVCGPEKNAMAICAAGPNSLVPSS